MLMTNESTLVEVSVSGEVVAPRMPPLPAMPHTIDRAGRPVLVPSFGGIVLNVKVGDPALGWVADHVNPGVSIKHGEAEPNAALTALACLGNTATIMSGAAKGARGVVTGKSGRWAEQVIVHFGHDALAGLAIGDRIQVRARGVGLTIDQAPAVSCKSLGPNLFRALECRLGGGRLEVPVVAMVPPELLGAGLGLNSEGWSVDIQSGAPEVLRQHGLDELRLGDVVALMDSDSTFNHGYKKGGVSIGVVCQGDSHRAGFGPGVTVIMTAPGGEISPKIRPGVNLTSLLDLT